MSRAGAFIRKELLELLPPTLFFLVVFHVVVVARDLMGDRDGIGMTTSAAATLGALVVGKAILIADSLPLFRRFQTDRLVFDVIWRTFLFLCLVLVFQLLEEAIPLVRERGVGGALSDLEREVDWTRFWATHLLLAMFLTFYAFVTALIDLVGTDRCLEAFFGWRRSPPDDEGPTV